MDHMVKGYNQNRFQVAAILDLATMVILKDTGLGTISKSLEHALDYIRAIFGVFRLIGVKYI